MGQHSSSRAGPGASFPRRLAAILAGFVLIALLSHGILSLLRSARAGRAGFGGARWIWFSASPERHPARFTALRDLTLSTVPRRALVRLFVDRRFTLRVNGVPAAAGGHQPGEAASFVDVTPRLKAGRNSFAILAESPDGIGGILFALDLGGPAPALVSDGSWSIDPTGQPAEPPGLHRAALLGRPPLFPWGWTAVEGVKR
ncbi:MAG: hypothetical protein LC796_04395 [Acidobacteria bacterium]|nr:hypothetical protein [Acidobacteriota bacterium]MCA1609357.1 hypothetical protein [Acidobacteriota bacterium]